MSCGSDSGSGRDSGSGGGSGSSIVNCDGYCQQQVDNNNYVHSSSRFKCKNSTLVYDISIKGNKTTIMGSCHVYFRNNYWYTSCTVKKWVDELCDAINLSTQPVPTSEFISERIKWVLGKALNGSLEKENLDEVWAELVQYDNYVQCEHIG